MGSGLASVDGKVSWKQFRCLAGQQTLRYRVLKTHVFVLKNLANNGHKLLTISHTSL